MRGDLVVRCIDVCIYKDMTHLPEAKPEIEADNIKPQKSAAEGNIDCVPGHFAEPRSVISRVAHDLDNR